MKLIGKSFCQKRSIWIIQTLLTLSRAEGWTGPEKLPVKLCHLKRMLIAATDLQTNCDRLILTELRHWNVAMQELGLQIVLRIHPFYLCLTKAELTEKWGTTCLMCNHNNALGYSSTRSRKSKNHRRPFSNSCSARLLTMKISWKTCWEKLLVPKCGEFDY